MYRDAPDLVRRVHELEEQLGEAKSRNRELEKELRASRRERDAAVRLAAQRKIFRVSWTAVKGISFGLLGASLPAMVDHNPWWLLGGSAVGLCFAFVVRQVW